MIILGVRYVFYSFPSFGGLGKDFFRVYQCRVSKLRRLNLLFDILIMFIYVEINSHFYLLLQRHFYRHAREGGHPEPQLYLKTNWIPAFAGMTIEINI